MLRLKDLTWKKFVSQKKIFHEVAAAADGDDKKWIDGMMISLPPSFLPSPTPPTPGEGACWAPQGDLPAQRHHNNYLVEGGEKNLTLHPLPGSASSPQLPIPIQQHF